jgi:hypothetical protein
MKNSQKTAGVTLVVTVLIVMLLLASVVVVTGQLALSARRSSADQNATLQAQYVAESGVARAQAQVGALGKLLDSAKFKIPKGTRPTEIASDVAAVCGLATLPAASVTPVMLCGTDPTTQNADVPLTNYFATNPISDANVSIFTKYVSDQNLESVGFRLSQTATKADIFKSLFTTRSVNSAITEIGTATAEVSVKIVGVKRKNSRQYVIYFQNSGVSSLGNAGTNTERKVELKTDQKIYAFNIAIPNFPSGQFMNHNYSSQACETTSTCSIFFTQNSNFSGPVHTNQNAYFALSGVTNNTSPRVQGSTFSGGFSSAGCPRGQITSAPSPDGELDPNTGAPVYVDTCVATATKTPGAFFNGSTSGDFKTPTQLDNQGNGSTSTAPNVNGTQPVFNPLPPAPPIPNSPRWDAGFIPLPPNTNDQTTASQNGGIYLRGDVSKIKLAADASITLNGTTAMTQTITYTKNVGDTPVQLAYRADRKMFIKTGNPPAWQPAAQTPCLPAVTTPALPACSTSGGDWAAIPTNAVQGTFTGIIYAQNGINDLNGPARTPANAITSTAANTLPALANFAKITVGARQDVNITSDLKYESPPCIGTSVANPDCSNKEAENILGIFSGQGDIVIKTPVNDLNQPNPVFAPPNVTIHATLLAAGGAIPGTTNRLGRIRVDGYQYATNQGNLNLLGGLIENYYGAFGTFSATSQTGYGRNIIYDERSDDNVTSPFFYTQRDWSGVMKANPTSVSDGVPASLGLDGSQTQGIR